MGHVYFYGIDGMIANTYKSAISSTAVELIFKDAKLMFSIVFINTNRWQQEILQSLLSNNYYLRRYLCCQKYCLDEAIITQ